jgi:lactoylglutathione lyase
VHTAIYYILGGDKMEVKQEILKFVTRLQHVGIPTNDIQKTIDFYRSLGFKIILETIIEATNEKVVFLELKSLVIEAYETGTACNDIGSIDHIAIDVTDIEKVFDIIKVGGYEMLHDQIQYLPFWSSGVKFFTIKGPNAEKIEFNKKL